jgi:phosphoribosylamine--glycine ligase
MQKVTQRILTPTIEGFKKDEIVYKGFVYVGLILVAGEPFVIEYNCRMGDPETEVVMPRLESDLVVLLKAVADEKLNEHEIRISDKAACTVVLTSGGYPEDFEKGKSIILPTDTSDSIIFHAGTKADGNELLTNGGRVMALTSLAPTLKDALIQSLQIAEKVSYEGKYYRKDIGYEFV